MTDKLTHQDCRDVGFCAPGLRRACEAHGQDFKLLTRGGGIPLADLKHIKDANVKRAVEQAHRRIKNGK